MASFWEEVSSRIENIAKVIVEAWNAIVDFLKNFVKVIREILAKLRNVQEYASRIFSQKIKEAGKIFRIIKQKIFYREDGSWTEQIVIRKVSENEVPAWVKEHSSMVERDVTEEFKTNLDLELA